jgi:hypothetical protein
LSGATFTIQGTQALVNFITTKCKEAHILDIMEAFLETISQIENVTWERNLPEALIRLSKDLDMHRNRTRNCHLIIAELTMDQVFTLTALFTNSVLDTIQIEEESYFD